MTNEAFVWDRKTPWRQGSILSSEACASLRLCELGKADETCVVVISHDCDLANDKKEPTAEVIVGRWLDRTSGLFERGRNPRQLHLKVDRDGRSLGIELLANAKKQVRKAEMARFEPQSSVVMSDKSLRTLRYWLASRYRRSAFPDGFVRRLQAAGLDEKLEAICAEYNSVVRGLYFLLDTRADLASNDPRAYDLRILVLYEPGDRPNDAADRAGEAAAKIEATFKAAYLMDDSAAWTSICLHDIAELSDQEVTVAKLERFDEWRIEHLSLKDGEEAAMSPGLNN